MKTMTYLFNLTLFVVCTQFSFAADSNNSGTKVFISPEEAELAAEQAAEEEENGQASSSLLGSSWRQSEVRRKGSSNRLFCNRR